MSSTKQPFKKLSQQAQSILSVLAVLPNEKIPSSFLELHFSFDEGEQSIDLLSPVLGEESGEDYIKSMLMSIGSPSEEYVDAHIEKVRLEKGKKAIEESIQELISQNWIEKIEKQDKETTQTYYFLSETNRTQLLETQKEQIWKITYPFFQSWEYKMQSDTLLNKNYEEYASYAKHFLELNENQIPFLEVEEGIIQDVIAKICKEIALYAFENTKQKDAFFFIEKSAFLQKKLTEKFPNNIEYENELGTIYEKWGDILYKSGHIKTAFSFYNLKVGIAEKLARQFPDNEDFVFDLASLYGGLGKLDFEREKYKKSKEWYEQQSEYIKNTEGLIQDVDFLHLLNEATDKLAEVSSLRGYPVTAIEKYRENLDYLEQLQQNFPDVLTKEQELNYGDLLGETNQKIGNFYYKEQQFKIASEFFQDQIDIYEFLIDEAKEIEGEVDYFQNCMTIGIVMLGKCYLSREENDKALELFNEAENIFLEMIENTSDREDEETYSKNFKVVQKLKSQIH
ncbi:hypothetical protein WAF17_17310 [Bernardetia sp. ABR2-2B]|uniref:hypothetical protein n=1 Tax=Bernardetia sp. ABR2-2B TaxID=3127472 RepID=UPI0030D01F61